MTEFSHINREKLPEQWQITHFGNLVKFSMGKTPPRKDKEYWDDGKYAWVSISDMIQYGIIFDTAEKVSEIAHEKIFRRKLIPPGHILMSFKLTIGRVSKIGIPAYHNEAIISFRPDNYIIFEDYIFFFLSQINYLNYQDKAIKGNTLNKSKIAKLEIAYPPLPEQHRIAAILTAVQRAIEQQERLITLTTELKKALMQKLFTEGTRGEPQKMTEIGPVPESWEIYRLEEIAQSFTYGTSVKCDYGLVGYPVLRIPNVVGGHIDVTDLKYGVLKPHEKENLLLKRGDLLFVRTNGVQENAGRCSMYRGELGDNCYFASYLIRVRLDAGGIIPEFVEEYSRTEIGSRFLGGKAVRTADGKFNINTGTLKDVLVPFPKLDQQVEIVDMLALIDDKSAELILYRQSLQDLFRTLLHQLMTAQIRVNDVDLTELNAIGIEAD